MEMEMEMEMEVGLPMFILLKSDDNKFLTCVPETTGFLQFNGDAAESPYSKMAVQLPKTGYQYTNHFHLLCCYNNKYWVKSSTHDDRIAAKAAKPEEDQTKWSCTLFKLIFPETGANSVQFLHVQSGKYVFLQGSEPGLYLGNSETGRPSVFEFIDWDTIVILPSHVTLKGQNGKYLNDASQLLQLKSGDGGIVKGKSMKANDEFKILPVSLSKNLIALSNTIDGSFCHTMEDNFGFEQPTITKQAQFEVEELVASKKVYDIKFRLQDARIYNESSVVVASEHVANGSKQPYKFTFSFKYAKKAKKSWHNNLTMALGVKFTLESKVPYATSNDQIQISKEVFKGEYEWGNVIETEEEVETEYKLIVPPLTEVWVKVVGEKASYDVPFTYSQKDVVVDGNESVDSNEDGVFSGNNFFAFNFVTENDPLMFV